MNGGTPRAMKATFTAEAAEIAEGRVGVNDVDATIDARMSPRLIAMSDDTRRAIEGEFLTINRLPFRVGRDSRAPSNGLAAEAERRKGTAGQVNDAYLLAHFHHVSREHFLIDAEHGLFYVVDRRSLFGTIVAGKTVGGARTGGRSELHDQDVIVAGTAASPYVFKFVVD
jgi:hypothetical protein